MLADNQIGPTSRKYFRGEYILPDPLSLRIRIIGFSARKAALAEIN